MMPAWTPEKSIAVMWSRINKNGPNGCWEYSGQVNSRGYGAFTYAGKPMVAVHRFIYQQVHGPLPKEVFCLHKCDNRICCNPDHIFLGSYRENSHDMYAKDRHMGKLRAHQVREIREALKSWKLGMCRKLADKYGVSPSVISDLRTGQSYNFVK